MERVSPKNSSRNSRKSSREEERRRLKVIHDTYADRIRLLSMIYSPDDDNSSAGDDSFAYRSPSPLPLGGGETGKGAQLNGLGIEDGIDESKATPQIAISGEPSPTFKTQIEREQEDEAREVLLNESKSRKVASSLQRSDSEGSYQSARSPAVRGPSEGISNLALPTDNLMRSKWQAKGLTLGGEEDLVTPATPYFDIDPHLVSVADSDAIDITAAKQEKLQVEKLVTSGQASNSDLMEGRRSRSPQERINRGISSLHDIPTAKAIAAKENQTSGPSSRRFLSVGSDALLQKEILSSQSSPVRDSDANNVHSSPSTSAVSPSLVKGSTEWHNNVANSSLTRPRALTIAGMIKNEFDDPAKALVNTNVSNGTISQRRKMAAEGGNSSSMGGTVNGSDDDAMFANLALPSQSTSDFETVKDRGGSHSSSLDNGKEDGSDARTGGRIGSRKRAISQPNRRPSIPASFMVSNPASSRIAGGPSEGAPPVPRITRKASMPLSPLVLPQHPQHPGALKANPGNTAVSGFGGSTAGFRFPSPAFSTSSGYHALGTPSTPFVLSPWQSTSGEGKGAMIADLFPSSLPSVQMASPPSFTSNSQSISLPWMGISNATADSGMITIPPSQKNLRPFYTMKLLLASMEQGSYITRRLFMPKDLWLQSGSRLLAIESKVRMLDSVSSGIEGIDQAGHFLLRPTNTDQPGLNAINASKFLKLLEEFETLLIEVQNSLAKKLGFLETVTGKKASNSFGSLSNKLTRSLDRMTHNSSKHIDTPATYVESLSRLFSRAQVLGDHLNTLQRSKKESGGGGGGGGKGYASPSRDSDWDSISVDSYATLPAELKRNLEVKLKRFSEFFTNVILRFVLRDVAILMDKSIKRNTALLTE